MSFKVLFGSLIVLASQPARCHYASCESDGSMRVGFAVEVRSLNDSSCSSALGGNMKNSGVNRSLIIQNGDDRFRR